MTGKDFHPGDIEGARRCMRKEDEFIVAVPADRTNWSSSDSHGPTLTCLFSCTNRTDADDYIESNKLSKATIYWVTDNLVKEV